MKLVDIIQKSNVGFQFGPIAVENVGFTSIQNIRHFDLSLEKDNSNCGFSVAVHTRKSFQEKIWDLGDVVELEVNLMPICYI